MPSDEQARSLLAEHPFPANPWVKVTDDAILIRAGYNEAMQRMLRWVPKTRWRADLRCWSVPLSGAELVRSVLPEISRLAEAMQETPCPAQEPEPAPDTADDVGARTLFRDAARLLYGSDWQRETARALGREEAALARWLVGEAVAEAPPAQLLAEILVLMRRRATDIRIAADVLERTMERSSRIGG